MEVMIRIAPLYHLCHPAKRRAFGGTIERSLPVVTDRRRVMTFKWLLRLLFASSPAALLLFGGYTAWNLWSSRSQSSSQVQGEPFATRTTGRLTNFHPVWRLGQRLERSDGPLKGFQRSAQGCRRGED